MNTNANYFNKQSHLLLGWSLASDANQFDRRYSEVDILYVIVADESLR